jgi:hypothetical protein
MPNPQDIQIITSPVSLDVLRQAATASFGTFGKGVVDLDRQIMAIGGELHADEEAVLLEDGSEQKNLWGINLYPDQAMPDMVEFDSMINIRPNQNNRSRNVQDPVIQQKILELVAKLVIFKND